MSCPDGWEAFAKGEKQLWAALQANFSSDQCRYQAPLLREKTKPGFRVCPDMNIRLADQAILDVQHSILDLDRGFALFRTCKSEMEGCIEPARLVWLEDIRHKGEQPGNRAWPQTIANRFYGLVLELAPRYRFGVGAGDHVNRLGTFLQRLHHLREVALLILQVGADDVFAR